MSLLQIHHDAKGSSVLHGFGLVGTSHLEYFKPLFKRETGKRMITAIPGIMVALKLPSDHCPHLVMMAHCYHMWVFSFCGSLFCPMEYLFSWLLSPCQTLPRDSGEGGLLSAGCLSGARPGTHRFTSANSLKCLHATALSVNALLAIGSLGDRSPVGSTARD